VMPFLSNVDRRIWWLTVSKAVDRSSKRSIEDLASALASLRASTAESKAVSGRMSTETRLVVLCEKGRDLVEHSSLKCLAIKGKSVL